MYMGTQMKQYMNQPVFTFYSMLLQKHVEDCCNKLIIRLNISFILHIKYYIGVSEAVGHHGIKAPSQSIFLWLPLLHF